MKKSLIQSMLAEWESLSVKAGELVSTEIQLKHDDLLKVEALAETYGLQSTDLLAGLIATALDEVEQQMPYVKGSRVIRVEEGDPVYEDAGRAPRYLEVLNRLRKSHDTDDQK